MRQAAQVGYWMSIGYASARSAERWPAMESAERFREIAFGETPEPPPDRRRRGPSPATGQADAPQPNLDALSQLTGKSIAQLQQDIAAGWTPPF